MKDKDIRDLVSLADETYIREAEPGATTGGAIEKRRWLTPLRTRVIALVACFALLFSAVGITLYSVLQRSDYTGSPYYPVISGIAAYQKKNAPKKSSFLDSIFGGAGGGNAASDLATAPDNTGASQEITDHQVAGVKEANRIARTDTHIFYLDGRVLRAYSIAAEETAEVGGLSLTVENARFLKTTQAEFFLSESGNVITLFLPHTDKNGKNRVDLVTLDVSDPAEMREIARRSISGSYLTSRKVGDSLFLITEYSPDAKIDFRKEETYLPGLSGDDGFSPVAPDKIVLPQGDISSLSYSVVTRLSDAGGEAEVAAFLSYSDDIYVSATRIYSTRSYYETATTAKDSRVTILKSEIARLRYADGPLTAEPSLTTEGRVQNRFCLDEANGILRVVTTVNRNYMGSVDVVDVADTGTSASLFCFSLADGTCVAKVERFAPTGETVRSARFDGDRLYVCTSVQNLDPVFFFDLSDLSAIEVKDTGTIDGFSTSLIPFGDALVGIGEGETPGSLKIEVFEETGNGVRSLSSYVRNNTAYADEYKAYAIDRTAGVLGLGATIDGTSYYLVFIFDGTDLFLAEKFPLAGDPMIQRGCLVGNRFYAFGASDFAVRRIFGE